VGNVTLGIQRMKMLRMDFQGIFHPAEASPKNSLFIIPANTSGFLNNGKNRPCSFSNLAIIHGLLDDSILIGSTIF